MSDFNEKDYSSFFEAYDPEKIKKTEPRQATKTKKKKVKLRLSRMSVMCILLAFLIFVTTFCVSKCSGNGSVGEYNTLSSNNSDSSADDSVEAIARKQFAVVDESTKAITEIYSDYAVLIDVDDKKVLAHKKMNELMYPASMTKVMTALVALERVQDVNEKCTITAEMIDHYYKQGATMAGFTYGEQVKIIDLLYAALLKSGADASAALAIYTYGSEEAFVAKMNETAKSMGLESTNFTNPVGMHHNSHYTTAYEMACIMQKALENPVIKEILQYEGKYKTSPTPEHPNSLEFKSTFISRIYKEMAVGVNIDGGKTGYTSASGHSAVSFATRSDGHTLVLVTAHSVGNRYYPIYDCRDIYTKYNGISVAS